LPDFGVIFTEALKKSGPPVAAPPHFQKIIRRGEDEEENE
jgi:hypothetical protein